MSRQIQMRRGSADEHTNFIGAAGEVTVDTTNQTLRVHDGQTPGGTILARADAEVDMSQITHDNARQLIGNRIWISEEISLSASTNIVINHNLDLEKPYMATAIPYLKFYENVSGYSVGDIISQFGFATHAYLPNNSLVSSSDYGHILNIDTNTVTIPRSQYGKIYLPNKTTGVPFLYTFSENSIKLFVKIIY